MKNLIWFSVVACFVLTSCGRSKEHDHHSQDSTEKDNPNLALYNQVQDVHEELMSKMESLYTLKKEIGDKMANTKDMVADKKEELKKIIAGLDSANHGMMEWMHNFNPLPDSVDQEKAREYLETQLEQIKKLKEQTNDIIEKAKEQVGKK